MKKLKVGIIGCGGIANSKHLPALTSQKDKCEIVAFCDIIRERAEKAAAQYGAGRVALAVERVAADFFLPAPSGQGHPLSQEELKALMDEREPAVFFSNELCAHYFTYMNRQNGAHFVLFDDAASIRKKLAADSGRASRLYNMGQGKTRLPMDTDCSQGF